MALPKHNPVLKVMYFFSIIGMFVFMSLVIRSYWPQDTVAQPLVIDHQPATQVISTDIANNSATQSDQQKSQKPGTIKTPDLYRVTRSYPLDLNGDIEAQHQQFWQEFYDDKEIHTLEGIESHFHIYQVYRNYDPATSGVEVLLGYRVTKASAFNNTNSLHIPAADALPRHNVLYSWQNYKQLPAELTFDTDYEVFQLNKHFEVISQRAYLHVK